jgi:hypothetical protein
VAEFIDLAPMRAFIDQAKAAGLRITEDPAQLVPPGFLVQLQSATAITLDGWELGTRVLAVVPNSGDHGRSADELVALVNELLELVDPDGPVTAVSVQLPGDATPLPALSVPLNIT